MPSAIRVRPLVSGAAPPGEPRHTGVGAATAGVAGTPRGTGPMAAATTTTPMVLLSPHPLTARLLWPRAGPLPPAASSMATGLRRRGAGSAEGARSSCTGFERDGRGTARHLDAGARSARHAGSARPGKAVHGSGDDVARRSPLTRGADGNRAVPAPRAADAPAADSPLHQVATGERAGRSAGGTAAKVHIPPAPVQPGAVPARPVLRRDHATERERDRVVAIWPGCGCTRCARPARRVLPGPAGDLLPPPRAGRRDPAGAHQAARRR
jgi:hypothetical protein